MFLYWKMYHKHVYIVIDFIYLYFIFYFLKKDNFSS